MKNKSKIGSKFMGNESYKNLRAKVLKIMETREGKRDFRPLFNNLKPSFLSEEEKKNCIYDVCKKYFEIRNNIKNEDKNWG